MTRRGVPRVPAQAPSSTGEGATLYLLAAATAESLLTIVHHVYGGLRYPGADFRFHVVFPVAAALAALWALVLVHRARSRAALRVAIAALVGAIFVAWLGLFEGLYNHVAKNVLFNLGLAPTALRRLFPPGMYEAPADAVFEASGALTFGVAVVVAHALWRFLHVRGASAP